MHSCPIWKTYRITQNLSAIALFHTAVVRGASSHQNGGMICGFLKWYRDSVISSCAKTKGHHPVIEVLFFEDVAFLLLFFKSKAGYHDL